MRPALILAATLISTSVTAAVEGAVSGTVAVLDPIESAIQHYAQVNTYTVIVRSVKQNKKEELRYYFKRPGFVRMEFIKPHAGAVLVFSPLNRMNGEILETVTMDSLELNVPLPESLFQP